MGSILRKTKHVIFLDTPQTSLNDEVWKQISQGSASEQSLGCWKIWSTALSSSRKVFSEIAHLFNITSTFATWESSPDDSDHSVSMSETRGFLFLY